MTAAIESDAEATGSPVVTKRFGKRTIIIAVIVLVVLLAGAGAAWYFMRAPAGPEAEAGETHDSAEGEGETAYIEVPALVVNLRSSDGTARFIKLRVMLVPASAADGEVITARLPLIVDSFQPFLRELRPEDLAGAAAVFRIKEELLVRANTAVGKEHGKAKVKNVLIQDLIQQ